MNKKPTTITRRDAAKALSAGAVLAVLPACNREPARITAAPNQVRCAVIGTGDRGTFLLKRLLNVGNCRVGAACDIYEPNLQSALLAAAEFKPKAYRDHRELLADKDIDAVIVATPLYRHFDVTRDALLAGKHVLCEKSIVFKPEEVLALRKLAGERPRQVVQVGLQRRYSPFYLAAKAMVDKGMLGTITHVRAQWHRNGAGRRPIKDPKLDRQINWRFYREYSGGLTAELASHAMDVADWFLGSHPEFVCGIGGIDYWKDGRETYDNIQLLMNYPGGGKFQYSAISTNAHCNILRGARPQFGEVIMGTAGTIEITIADVANPAVGPAMAMWFREPNAPKIEKAGGAQENWVAGATIPSAAQTSKGLPLLLPKDQMVPDDSFVGKEMKFARRWLYSHGITVPEEDRNPVEISLEDFFNCIMYGGRPKADVEVGLWDSIGVILSNRAMDEGRRVYYSEMDA